MMEVKVTSYLKYVLDLQSFVIYKLPEDGAFVLKYVGLCTFSEVCFMM
jgi:hypothetical protein